MHISYYQHLFSVEAHGMKKRVWNKWAQDPTPAVANRWWRATQVKEGLEVSYSFFFFLLVLLAV
jgi:hypothetical protein